jgi:hypothetical protein
MTHSCGQQNVWWLGWGSHLCASGQDNLWVPWELCTSECVDVVFDIREVFYMTLEKLLPNDRVTCIALKQRIRAVRCD